MQSWICPVFSIFWNRSQMLPCVKNIGLSLYNCKSKIRDVCNAVEGHCLQAMTIVRHHANGCFDWLISRQQSVNPSREAISILSDLHLSILWSDYVNHWYYNRAGISQIVYSITYKIAFSPDWTHFSTFMSGGLYRPGHIKSRDFGVKFYHTYDNGASVAVIIDSISEVTKSHPKAKTT